MINFHDLTIYADVKRLVEDNVYAKFKNIMVKQSKLANYGLLF